VSDNLFVVASGFLVKMNKIDEYNEMQKTVRNVADLKERMHLQEKLAMQIYRAYPLMTLGTLLYNAIGIMGRAHWPLVANFWGYNFKDDFSSGQMPLKKSAIVFLIEILFNIIYFIIYLFCFSFFIRNLQLGNFGLLTVVVLLLAYLLGPTFINSSAGGRMRLPIEGLIIIMASKEIILYFKEYKRRRAVSVHPDDPSTRQEL
jgi:hypothetical protein